MNNFKCIRQTTKIEAHSALSAVTENSFPPVSRVMHLDLDSDSIPHHLGWEIIGDLLGRQAAAAATAAAVV